ncbi:hypothetical protein TBLA_0A05170 [Henningerozyma blattae CBS 6284]|uniref:Nitroreductase domain-containing protein n=1 Tax=Henningerozyma blattae (strain ATCC 34711 / CBS 6284 / DSM 70876 / NBRC 10599 / NRRL Y-10934 / UCD 77-7) TaxID=1071380 RepID=I2GW08_HENB6|nr:hypothetical protein TBLA_0A05170 [Tetrapisispora blattae CBS 6284]CCH58310.1 hypothetical protein TBLA_0A05170 [Tetrapisispora blattae CBS 6284]
MSAASPILKPIAQRRTIYALKPVLPSNVTLKDIQSIVQEIVKETPSAFNSQPNRAVIITGATKTKVWDSVVKAIGNGDGAKRPASIRDEAFGSVLFFTDSSVTKNMQSQFAIYKDAFPVWADQSSGAVQIQAWTALEAIGLGGHLQHYNQLVEAALPADIPKNWVLQAQLNFGVPAAPAGEKEYASNPVKVYE